MHQPMLYMPVFSAVRNYLLCTAAMRLAGCCFAASLNHSRGRLYWGCHLALMRLTAEKTSQ
jgi:hypothetical protein